jgi:hypothetical protein
MLTTSQTKAMTMKSIRKTITKNVNTKLEEIADKNDNINSNNRK